MAAAPTSDNCGIHVGGQHWDLLLAGRTHHLVRSHGILVAAALGVVIGAGRHGQCQRTGHRRQSFPTPDRSWLKAHTTPHLPIKHLHTAHTCTRPQPHRIDECGAPELTQSKIILTPSGMVISLISDWWWCGGELWLLIPLHLLPTSLSLPRTVAFHPAPLRGRACLMRIAFAFSRRFFFALNWTLARQYQHHALLGWHARALAL